MYPTSAELQEYQPMANVTSSNPGRGSRPLPPSKYIFALSLQADRDARETQHPVAAPLHAVEGVIGCPQQFFQRVSIARIDGHARAHTELRHFQIRGKLFTNSPRHALRRFSA